MNHMMKRIISIAICLLLLPAIALGELTLQIVDDADDPHVIVIQNGSERIIRPDDPPVFLEEEQTSISIGECKNADVIVLFTSEFPTFDGSTWPRYVFYCTDTVPDYASSALYYRTVYACTAANGTITYTAGEQRPASAEFYYVGNANSGKLHYHWCSSVDVMKDSNKIIMFDRDQAVGFGYVPCKRCKP